MTRCPNTTTPRQHLGRKRYRLARRTMRCVREEGHDGPCCYEASAAPDPEPYEPRPIAKPAPVEKVDLHALFRENLRRRTFGR